MVTLTGMQLFITILAIACGTMMTRFLPTLIFPTDKRVPPFVQRLQTMLPSAAIGLLVVYCLRNISIFRGNRGLPELLAVSVVVLLHRLFKRSLLSIAGGTITYMLLIQWVF